MYYGNNPPASEQYGAQDLNVNPNNLYNASYNQQTFPSTNAASDQFYSNFNQSANYNKFNTHNIFNKIEPSKISSVYSNIKSLFKN